MSKVVNKVKKGIKTGASSLEKYAKSGAKKTWDLHADVAKEVSGYGVVEDIRDWMNKPYEEMEEANRAAMQQQADLAEQARMLQSNLSRDLRGENVAEVIAGGSSELSGMSGSGRRRRQGTGLTSSLQV